MVTIGFIFWASALLLVTFLAFYWDSIKLFLSKIFNTKETSKFKFSKFLIVGLITLVLGIFLLIGIIVITIERLFASPVDYGEIGLLTYLFGLAFYIFVFYSGYIVYQKTKGTKSIYFHSSVILMLSTVIGYILDSLDYAFFNNSLINSDIYFIFAVVILASISTVVLLINSKYLLKIAELPSVRRVRGWSLYLIKMSVIGLILAMILGITEIFSIIGLPIIDNLVLIITLLLFLVGISLFLITWIYSFVKFISKKYLKKNN